MAARKHRPKTKVAIIMGSQSDYPTMVEAEKVLDKLGVPYERHILSAHRTPDRLVEGARAMYRRGIRVVIAGAGGSAHLAGMTTAFEPMLTVKGVPCPSASNQLNDWAAVFSMAFMPKGVGNATYSIGAAGAVNAALDAAKFVAEYDPNLRRRLRRYYDNQTAAVAFKPSREKLKEQKK